MKSCELAFTKNGKNPGAAKNCARFLSMNQRYSGFGLVFEENRLMMLASMGF
jgi:hypothetical protein